METDIDAVIQTTEHQLYANVASLTDREIRRLVEDIATLKRAKEIAERAVQVTAPSHNGHSKASGNGYALPLQRVNISQGDMVLEILKTAGRPMHISEIVEILPKYGIYTNKQNLIGIVGSDRRKRFVRTGPNVFALNPSPKSFDKSPSLARRRKDHPFPANFSLVDSIKALLPEIEGEFSQRTVYDMLVKRYPEAMPHIKRDTVGKMLTRLKTRGLLEVTSEGFGKEPRRFKKKEEMISLRS